MSIEATWNRIEAFVKWFIARPRSFATKKFGAFATLVAAVFGAPWFVEIIRILIANATGQDAAQEDGSWITLSMIGVFGFALLTNLIVALRGMRTKERMMELGALGAVMSGSGPTVLAVVDGRAQARGMAERLAAGGYRAFALRATDSAHLVCN